MQGGSWCGPKGRLRSETRTGLRGAYLRGLRLGCDYVVVKGTAAPLTLRGGRYPGKTHEIPGGKCVRRPG